MEKYAETTRYTRLYTLAENRNLASSLVDSPFLPTAEVQLVPTAWSPLLIAATEEWIASNNNSLPLSDFANASLRPFNLQPNVDVTLSSL